MAGRPKFTQGPWQEIDQIIGAESGAFGADAWPQIKNPDDESLILAAPDLYEACAQACDFIGAKADALTELGYAPGEEVKLYRRLYEALAAARGEHLAKDWA